MSTWNKVKTITNAARGGILASSFLQGRILLRQRLVRHKPLTSEATYRKPCLLKGCQYLAGFFNGLLIFYTELDCKNSSRLQPIFDDLHNNLIVATDARSGYRTGLLGFRTEMLRSRNSHEKAQLFSE